MSMQSIRVLYDVPAKRGMRVTHVLGESGVITSARGNSLRIRTDHGGRLECHPRAVFYPAGTTTPAPSWRRIVTLRVPALEAPKGAA